MASKETDALASSAGGFGLVLTTPAGLSSGTCPLMASSECSTCHTFMSLHVSAGQARPSAGNVPLPALRIWGDSGLLCRGPLAGAPTGPAPHSYGDSSCVLTSKLQEGRILSSSCPSSGWSDTLSMLDRCLLNE